MENRLGRRLCVFAGNKPIRAGHLRHADGGCFRPLAGSGGEGGPAADSCGDGRVSGDEKCDTAIESGAGACPEDCAGMGMTLEHPLHLWTYRLKLLTAELGGRGAQAVAAADAIWGA